MDCANTADCKIPQIHEGHSSPAPKRQINVFAFADIVSAVTDEINKTITTAITMILNDVKQEFFYPDPKIAPIKSSRYPSFLHFDAEYKEKYIDWINIQDFSVNEVFSQVRDYINLWHLSEATKFTLVVNDKANVIPRKGTKYFLDACFSKPTQTCPNPLTVAKVYFTVIVPELLPTHYPIKVIYRFEGYRTKYHANGRLEIRSKDFQRYFIDSILQRKLVFYTKIFECRHPKFKLEKKDEDELQEGEGKKAEKTRKQTERAESESDEDFDEVMLPHGKLNVADKLSVMSNVI